MTRKKREPEFEVDPLQEYALFTIDYYSYAKVIANGKQYKKESEFFSDLVFHNREVHIYLHKKKRWGAIPQSAYEYYIGPEYVRDNILRYKLKNLHYFFSSPFQRKIDAFFKINKIDVSKEEQIKSVIFNFYIKSHIELDRSRYFWGKEEIERLEEYLAVLDEFEKYKKIILKNLYKKKHISQQQKKYFEQTMANSKNEIALGFAQNDVNINNELPFENPAAFLKERYDTTCKFHPAVFKVGKKENISINQLLLDLYEIFKTDLIYLPNTMKTLEFIVNNTPAKIEGLKISKDSIRKRIKDLKKKDASQNLLKNVFDPQYQHFLKAIKAIRK